MNSNNFSKGDILEAEQRSKKQGLHFIIYVEENSSTDFIGAMITHSDNINNVSMSENHFCGIDNNGNRYKIAYEDTYLVKAKLIKFESWGPFSKVGKLTKRGIQFVEKVIAPLEAMTFGKFYKQTRR